MAKAGESGAALFMLRGGPPPTRLRAEAGCRHPPPPAGGSGREGASFLRFSRTLAARRGCNRSAFVIQYSRVAF